VKTYQIRPAKVDDIGSIASVALDSWKHTYGSIYPKDVISQFVARAYSAHSLTGSIERDSKHSRRLFHVAVDAKEDVIAFSHVVPYPNSDTSFELARIYALPQSHGTGVGTALLHHLLQTVPSVSELSAWVEQDNTIGRKFYERHAFKVVGEKEDDFFGYKAQLLKYTLVRDRD
jgi:GNAT superfamily N-acetyltransferase